MSSLAWGRPDIEMDESGVLTWSEMRGLMDRYQVNLQLEKVNQMNLESIHTEFNQVMVNLRSAKGSLINTMDNIYFNFVQPARWFY